MFAHRPALLFLFLGCFIPCAIAAQEPAQPTGYWVLENKDDEKPFGGLKLDRPESFSLLVFDSNCQLYQMDGNIRKKHQAWELKNRHDHSNTFVLTREANKLKLVDTEGQVMLFIPSSKEKLNKAVDSMSHKQCSLVFG